MKFVYDTCNKYHYCINRKVAPYHNKNRYKSSLCVFNNVKLEVLMNFLDLSCRNVYLDSKEKYVNIPKLVFIACNITVLIAISTLEIVLLTEIPKQEVYKFFHMVFGTI